MSTVELLDHLYAELRKLKNLVRTRRGRERALELVTEIFLVFNAIAKRVAGMSFSEGPVAVEDEDEQGEERGMPLAELFHGPDEDDHFSEEETDDIDELRRIIRELKMTRLERYKSIMAYLTKDCRNEIDISKRVVAINRRISPDLVRKFGLTQPAVGRKFAETRAAVSMREKTQVEKVLKASGARGILSNGARGAETSRACARAAKGNHNRKSKHTPS